MTWFMALATTASAGAVWWLIVPRLRVDDPDAPDFAALVSWRTLLGVLGTAGAASGVLWLVPTHHHWLWVPYLAVGVPLVAIDLLSTFLPKRLNALATALMAAGLAATAITDWRGAAAAALGAAGAFVFFYLAWRLSASLGFGDVRLALLIGAVSGLAGVGTWTTALLTGTALGAVHGIAHALWARRDAGRPRHFPFGPALWLGPLAAVTLQVTAG
ncbi:A24 family peptidase [Tessaracoccus sp. Y36]